MYFYSWTITDDSGECLMVGAVANSEDLAKEKIALEIEAQYEYLNFDMRRELSSCDVTIPVNDLVIITHDAFFEGSGFDEDNDDDF